MRDEPRNFNPAVGCEGKVWFPDFTEATKAAKRTNRHRDTARVGPYRCALCHYWHVGSHEGHGTDHKRDRRRHQPEISDSAFNSQDT